MLSVIDKEKQIVFTDVCRYLASFTYSLVLFFRSGKVWSPTGIEENKTSPYTGILESESQV